MKKELSGYDLTLGIFMLFAVCLLFVSFRYDEMNLKSNAYIGESIEMCYKTT